MTTIKPYSSPEANPHKLQHFTKAAADRKKRNLYIYISVYMQQSGLTRRELFERKSLQVFDMYIKHYPMYSMKVAATKSLKLCLLSGS